MKPEEQMRKKVESPSRKSGILWGWVNVALSAIRFSIRAGRLLFFSKFSLIPVLILLAVIPLAAFEAHILNVTATIVQIDPPVLTPPGDIGWDNSAGGNNLTGTVDIVMTDTDPAATHIYYTYGAGLDPLTVPTPVCGQIGPNGGGGLKIDVELVPLSLTSDTVVKAIACDGDGAVLPVHNSLVNTKIYDFANFACEPFQVNFPANLAVLAAGPGDSSSGDIFASAEVEINGDVRSNDDINANGGGANRTINGNATAGDDIEEVNFTISGTVAEGAVTTTLPDINIPLWKDKANDGGTVNGSLIIPGSVGTELNPLDLGPSEIMGNVVINTNNVLDIHGPLHIHGNLTIDSNVTINQDAAFGDQFLAIIVDGTIDISSNVAFNGAGALGTFLLVSTAGPQAGDNAAIEANSNNSDLGDVVLYASAGDVHINSNRTLLAIFAKLGTSNTAPAIDLDSNVTVNYSELPTTISCGPIFTPVNQALINEFLPNPLGSDQGTAGLPLDGEFVELYNGSGSSVDVNGYVLYDDFVPAGAAGSEVWTSTADFASGIMSNTTSTSNSVRLSEGQNNGTFEIALDVGEGNRGDWQNLTWGETLTSTADICIDVATSDDGISYTSFSSQDCASPFSLAGISDSRFIKWRSTHARPDSGDSAHLNDLTITYNFFNYHELIIASAKTNTGSTLIPSGGLLVVYRDGDTDFDLDNDGVDTVKLYNNHVWLGGSLVDSRTYDYGGSVPDDKSFTRMPDGTTNWVDPDPTPGEPNREFINPDTTPTEQIIFESEPLAEGEEEVIEEKEVISEEDSVLEEDASIDESEGSTSSDDETQSQTDQSDAMNAESTDTNASSTIEIASSTTDGITGDAGTTAAEGDAQNSSSTNTTSDDVSSAGSSSSGETVVSDPQSGADNSTDSESTTSSTYDGGGSADASETPPEEDVGATTPI